MPKPAVDVAPLYLQVKNHILENIGSGRWAASARVPSEHEIVRKFGVSRMTANRALKELQSEGVLVRIAGVGSFVAKQQLRSHPMEIHNIADEIRERGHAHRAQVVALERVRAVGGLATDFDVTPKTELFFSAIIHYENGLPILLEERHVLPRIGPDYLKVDFETTTPYEYLMKVAPLQQAEHVLRAVMPEERIRKLLAMKRSEPCLLIVRRTWTAGTIATVVRLHYPGTRYEMAGRFHP